MRMTYNYLKSPEEEVEIVAREEKEGEGRERGEFGRIKARMWKRIWRRRKKR